jgi:hypothetical protein
LCVYSRNLRHIIKSEESWHKMPRQIRIETSNRFFGKYIDSVLYSEHFAHIKIRTTSDLFIKQHAFENNESIEPEITAKIVEEEAETAVTQKNEPNRHFSLN